MTTAEQTDQVATTPAPRAKVSVRDALEDMVIIARRNLKQFRRMPQLLVFATVQPVMFLLLFNFVFGGALTREFGGASAGDYINFLIRGDLVQTVVFGATNTSTGLAEDLNTGVIDRFRSLPMARSAVMGGRTFADLVRSAGVQSLMLVVGVIIGFSAGSWPGLLLGLIIALLFGYAVSWAFAGLGLTLRSPEASQGASFVLVFPFVFASSVFVPTVTMPDWLRVFAENQPVSVIANTVRALSFPDAPVAGGDSIEWLLLKSTLWISGMLAVFGWIAVRQYKKAIASPMAVRVLVIGEQVGTPPPGLPDSDSRVEYVVTSDLAAMRDALPGTEIVFQYGTPKDGLRETWDAADAVRWVHVGGVGVDAVLFDQLVASDVVVTNSRGAFDVSLPEYVLSLMLALVKDLPGTVRAQADSRWQHRWLETLSGGRAVILGAGSIARATARMLRALDVEVTLVGRQVRDAGPEGPVHATSELGALLPQADWLIGLLPLTPGTRGLIGARELALLPAGARVVNIGRGLTFVEGDLVEALERGAIRSAALDVFEVEPLPQDSPLWRMPNVIVSPHEGGDVVGTGPLLTRVFLENLQHYLAGEPLRDVVDKRLGYVPPER